MIVIVDSGGSNISSIKFALERLGFSAKFTNDIRSIKEATHVILPGVGSADFAMNRLKHNGLDEVIVSLEQPVLGICLGMQLLFDFSEEGNSVCLGIIPGKVKRIPADARITVPHMGWNTIDLTRRNLLTHGIGENAHMYFVHTYIASITSYTCAVTHHGEAFSSIVQYKNFYGTQFHPERSGNNGHRILKNFLEI